MNLNKSTPSHWKGIDAYKILTHTHRWGHPCVRTHTHPRLPHLCVLESGYHLFDPPLLLFAFFFFFFCHVSFFSPPDTPLDAPECQTGQTDWLHVPMCVCGCDCSLCYVSCYGPTLPPCLPSPVLPPPAAALSLSQQQWHIQGTTFWLVNLMEPLPRGVAWINMAWRIVVPEEVSRSPFTSTTVTATRRSTALPVPVSSLHV